MCEAPSDTDGPPGQGIPGTTRSDLAVALRAWREGRRLTVSAAALAIGVSRTAVHQWETGWVCPQPLQLSRLATVLGWSLDEARSVAGTDRVRTTRTSGGAGASTLCLARLTAGLTMTQLARKVGVGPATVSRWENGVRLPAARYCPRLAAALGLTLDDLSEAITSDAGRRKPGLHLPGLGDLRRSRGMTQREVGRAVGVGSAAVAKWEGGRARVPHHRLAALAGVFHLDTPSFLTAARRLPARRPDVRPLRAFRVRAGVQPFVPPRSTGQLDLRGREA